MEGFTLRSRQMRQGFAGELVRHGIESALGEGIAAEQPPQRQRKPARGAVARNGFRGVVRARGMKSARSSEEWRKERDVEADQQEQRPGACRFRSRGRSTGLAGRPQGVGARGISCSNSLVSAKKSAVAAELRG